MYMNEIMLVFHFIPMASSHCSRNLPAVLSLWEADQLLQSRPLEDSWVSTADTLRVLALSWLPMPPRSVNRGSWSAKVAMGPGQPWFSWSNCGQSQELGQSSTYAPAPSCEVQEQMGDQYQLSWELRVGMEWTLPKGWKMGTLHGEVQQWGLRSLNWWLECSHPAELAVVLLLSWEDRPGATRHSFCLVCIFKKGKRTVTKVKSIFKFSLPLSMQHQS